MWGNDITQMFQKIAIVQVMRIAITESANVLKDTKWMKKGIVYKVSKN